MFPFCRIRFLRCSLGGEKSAANPFVESMQTVIDLVPLVFPWRLWSLPLKNMRRALVYVSSSHSLELVTDLEHCERNKYVAKVSFFREKEGAAASDWILHHVTEISHKKTFLAELKVSGVCWTDLNRNSISNFLPYVTQIKCNNPIVFRPIWIPSAIEEKKLSVIAWSITKLLE